MDNREIKFRAWDRSRGKMLFFTNRGFCDEYNSLSFGLFRDDGECHYDGEYFGFGDLGLEDREEETPVMQYTGLKDRNGKEIYEGDLLATPQYETRIGEVAWVGNHFGMGFSILHEGIPVDMGDNWKDFEVVGNIYETPHLINK